MRIVFTGGGSGGHFYPIIAVAGTLKEQASAAHLPTPELLYLADTPFESQTLSDHNIVFKKIPSGKRRRYFSFANFIDPFKTFWGFFVAFFVLLINYPDVIFSKGSYPSVPVVLAGALLRIPIVIHESDAALGRANKLASLFADYIGVAYPETAKEVNKDNVAIIGNPIRLDLYPRPDDQPLKEFDPNVPLILVLGGSLGAEAINNAVLQAASLLVGKYQVLHQTGKQHITEVRTTADFLLKDNPNEDRYHPVPYLDPDTLRKAAKSAELIVSRAGSGSIFEIALWGRPAILVPIPEAVSHDQRKNAFAYARAGGAVVIEQENLSANVLAAEIERLFKNTETREDMVRAAEQFSRPDSAQEIARILLQISRSHE